MSLVRFTTDHEWVRLDGDLAVVGITDYAQSQLGDVVYVELPEIGRRVEKGKEAAVVRQGQRRPDGRRLVSQIARCRSERARWAVGRRRL